MVIGKHYDTTWRKILHQTANKQLYIHMGQFKTVHSYVKYSQLMAVHLQEQYTVQASPQEFPCPIHISHKKKIIYKQQTLRLTKNSEAQMILDKAKMAGQCN